MNAKRSKSTIRPYDLEAELARALRAVDVARAREELLAADEFLFLPAVLPPELISRCAAEARALRPFVHRAHVPWVRKGGAVQYGVIREHAPLLADVYQGPALLRFLRRLTESSLHPCPERDPHAAAVYWYSEPGDHIAYHYDTSFYRDRRYTVLLGLHDRSSSQLEVVLHTRQPGHPLESRTVTTTPGSIVVFNGDTVKHRVTPLGEDEERVVLSLEYVTDTGMRPLGRAAAWLKDAFGYFGVRRRAE